jgi:hypothetical protein
VKSQHIVANKKPRNTFEKYLGCQQCLRGAVNDRIGIEPPQ